jgi:thiamine biosynthesis lipoprotein ApbE/Na+-translocating ferredoxin:NAD+ oxidoreductase RnfG subunit
MAGLFRPKALLQIYRAGVLAAFVLIIHQQAGWVADQKAPAVTLRDAGRFFPEARQIQVHDPSRGLHVVTDPLDKTLGGLMTTAPWTDHIIGYSGPNNLLIVLDPGGTIIRVELLGSGDTREFVDMVREASDFLPALTGWKPNEQSPPEIDAVSGATLTSFAVLEGVQERLLGAAPSLRFPDPVTLEEVQTIFPEAHTLQSETNGVRVFNFANELIGIALRTSPQADNISGYQGPTECLVGLDAGGQTVTGFRLRKSYDTPSYVKQVREAGSVHRLILNRTVEDLAKLKYPRRNLQGVSGATRTARAIVESVQRRFAAEVEERDPSPGWRPKTRDLAMAGVIIAALLMAFTTLRGRRWARLAWQLFLVGYVGLVNHDLLSLSLFAGWTSHGLALQAAPGLVLLTAAALLIPWGTRRQFYCHHVCPHGAAQQLLGTVFRRRWTIPTKVERWMKRIPGLLLSLIIIALLMGWGWDLAALEPFDAWNWKSAGVATLTLAVFGLVTSLFIPQSYCKYGCPTGAIFSFLRSSGSADRWGRRDALALLLLLAGVAVGGAVRARPHSAPELEPILLTGHTMGTTWSVKVRDELASPPVLEKTIAKEFEWAESLTSHWREETQISKFNRTHSTDPMKVPWPVMTLSRWSAEISRETKGAFDITVGPLVRLWGFGPGAQRDRDPTEADLKALRPRVGWEKLELLDDGLRKQHPELEVDLSSIAKGWAINKVVDRMEFQSYTDFLVEAGGELRAVGRWEIAIEHPTRTTTLLDESIATSGSYRQNYDKGGKRCTHLIDPRTGRPVTHRTVSVSVRHKDCARADAWATALNVLGVKEGMPVAKRLDLAAQFVVERSEGDLEVIGSPAWTKREQEVAAGR